MECGGKEAAMAAAKAIAASELAAAQSPELQCDADGAIEVTSCRSGRRFCCTKILPIGLRNRLAMAPAMMAPWLLIGRCAAEFC